MDFLCPHCKSTGVYATATRIQGPDDLSYQVDINTVRELWQCNVCNEYFLIDFKIDSITKLVKEQK